FLFLIDYCARLLRPVNIVWRIAEDGFDVIKEVYPQPYREPIVRPRQRGTLAPPDRTVFHTCQSAIVLAMNLNALVAAADRAGGVIEIIHRVGDFVALDEPLCRLHGGAATLDDRFLRAQIAFGRERTIQQDSTFAFRIIVDIALKALSQAINDPTTAV